MPKKKVKPQGNIDTQTTTEVSGEEFFFSNCLFYSNVVLLIGIGVILPLITILGYIKVTLLILYLAGGTGVVLGLISLMIVAYQVILEE